MGFDTLQNVLKDQKVDESVQLLIEGTFYIDYAWEARGIGFSNDVSEEGWKLFKERLEDDIVSVFTVHFVRTSSHKR